MLTAVVLALVIQQSAGAIQWESASPPPEPELAAVAPVARTNLPDWALADPFAWERSQCSPLVSREPLDICQARVRVELSAALGDRLPAGLRPPGEPVPCLATPGDDGKYPVQCGAPERRAAASAPPPPTDCRPRATRQGGSVAFVTDCRAEEQSGGLSINLLGRD
ncbi:hypothetical protein [Brevundimonas sp. NIBR11]|uniref:hypothetical protein n=1 Tax=Brevundimonas sp. NIBR11 TaxID=3015999 RepID=UPI0022F06E9C|nr:hypothetical protein [Brevundimonas sp. NIBR11]WGM31771.1 hypothetical protein KKHFBJBL_02020 [Brevundimonas sp. NIBR11]